MQNQHKEASSPLEDHKPTRDSRPPNKMLYAQFLMYSYNAIWNIKVQTGGISHQIFK
jgi:hypothetical protein